MKISHKMMLAAATAVAMSAMPTGANAESYDPNESDNPLRLFFTPFHVVGKGIEYGVTRPIHYVTSRPKLRTVFGRTSNPRTDNYWGGWDQYQRSSY